MPSLADAFGEFNKRQDNKRNRSTGAFEVVTTSPFEVYLDGGTVAVPALKVAGLSYSVGTKGRYFLDQGQQPLCLPTA